MFLEASVKKALFRLLQYSLTKGEGGKKVEGKLLIKIRFFFDSKVLVGPSQKRKCRWQFIIRFNRILKRPSLLKEGNN